MRRIFTLLAVILMAGTFALPAMAQETKAPKAKAEKKAPAAKTMRAIGSIVSADASTVTVKTKAGEEKFALTSDTKIKLDGKDATAAELAAGQSATVSFTKAGETMNATQVVAKTKAAPKAKATKKEPKK